MRGRGGWRSHQCQGSKRCRWRGAGGGVGRGEWAGGGGGAGGASAGASAGRRGRARRPSARRRAEVGCATWQQRGWRGRRARPSDQRRWWWGGGLSDTDGLSGNRQHCADGPVELKVSLQLMACVGLRRRALGRGGRERASQQGTYTDSRWRQLTAVGPRLQLMPQSQHAPPPAAPAAAEPTAATHTPSAYGVTRHVALVRGPRVACRVARQRRPQWDSPAGARDVAANVLMTK